MHTELGSSQVEVQRCTLSWEVGEELGEELARRKLRWKLMQTWSRRNRREKEEEEDEEEEEEEEEEGEKNNCDKIKQPSPGRWGMNFFENQLLELEQYPKL